MDFQNFAALIGFFLAMGCTVEAGTCGLQGLPVTSPTNLYLLPPIPDNLADNVRAWEKPYTGQVIGISSPSTPHSPYLSARFSQASGTYWLHGNARTQNFVKERETREMIRYITLRCSDRTNTTYHLKIPFQDQQAPEFSSTDFTFNITTDWDRKTRPISDGQFVIVSDNAIELEIDRQFLQYRASPDFISFVDAHPLWVLPYPDRYYLRLDIYMKEDIELEAGKTFQVNLSAGDDFNSGSTTITINVSE